MKTAPLTIADLVRLAGKPAIYTPGTANMWTDPYISTRLLATHLSQDTDLASRRTEAIETTLGFIAAHAPQGPLSVLDLGCGPGLYTERLAALGHRVTGMDISACALAHARQSAAGKGLDITYRHQDYLTLDDDGTFDLAIMIFTDFCVLSPDQRATLLGRIFKALKPGGVYIFDVLNPGWSPEGSAPRTWEAAGQGFWRPRPHLVLTENFTFKENGNDVFLSQHVVADDLSVEVYRFYIHTFSQTALSGLLEHYGFGRVRCRDRVLPDSELCRSKDLTFCTAVKP